MTEFDERCVNVVRGLAMDAVQKAESGHPGMPMGAAVMAHVLWSRFLRFDPEVPEWPDRDRFVLSAGHGSMLQYALLHLTGFDLPLEELKDFRQWGSRTPGHPENHVTPGVEMATGPLGQGLATAVGMAIAERWLAARYNQPGHTVVDHHTYVICSDGDLMEGVAQEACSFAGHQKLGKLIALYDDNSITIDGSTELAFTENTAAKFEAMGWHVQACDGMDGGAVHAALEAARAETERPSLICCKTVIGFGSPNKAGTAGSHGAPLGTDEVAKTKEVLGLPAEPFWIDPEVLAFYRQSVEKGAVLRTAWEERMDAYGAAHPELAEELERVLAGELPEGWEAALPAFEKADATRNASGTILNSLAGVLPELVGGCADLAGSVKTTLKDGGTLSATTPGARNVNYGVREHAMAAIVNGMTLHGGPRAYGGTFLVFSDYCRPSLRLAALMHCPAIHAMSHDSIGLGEDGPTHQPVEHVMSLRMIPNLNVMRPADGNEVSACWRIAIESESTPSVIVLARQNGPVLSPAYAPGHDAEKGGYVLEEASDGQPRVILVGTGTELALAVAAREMLEADGVPTRVVSLPSWFVFEDQPEAYIEAVLPRAVPTVSVEAGTTMGWARYADASIGIDHFGASAPYQRLYEEFGITADAVADAARSLLAAWDEELE